MASKYNWEEIISEYESSGLSKAEFCRIKNINRKSFLNGYYRYQKKLEQKESSFVPVVVDNTVQPLIRISINHIPLEFDPAIPDDGLKKVMKALVSL